MLIIKEDLFSAELSFRSTFSSFGGGGAMDGAMETVREVKNISIRVSQPQSVGS